MTTMPPYVPSPAAVHSRNAGGGFARKNASHAIRLAAPPRSLLSRRKLLPASEWCGAATGPGEFCKRLRLHRQIFAGDETIDYACMGLDPDAADNRWLPEAFENQVPHLLSRYRAWPLPGDVSGLRVRLGGYGVEGACRLRRARSGIACATGCRVEMWRGSIRSGLSVPSLSSDGA